MENLGDILNRLHQAGVEFVLVGGLAAVHHGASYATYDVDICVPLDRSNFRRIERAVSDLNPRFRQRKDLPFALGEELLAGLQNLYLLTDLGPLDCRGQIAGVGGYAAVLGQSEVVEFPFGPVRILKIGALIRAKEAIGRPQDLLVITQLRAIQDKTGASF